MLADTTNNITYGSSEPSVKIPVNNKPTLIELQRLGGIRSVLKLLDSKKKGLRETAALVLSNATFSHTSVCKELVSGEVETLRPLVEHLSDDIDMVALNVTRALANCTTIPDLAGGNNCFNTTLRRLGGVRLLIGALSTDNVNLLKPTLLAIGNMCYDDDVLAVEIRELGGLESLAILLQSEHKSVQSNALNVLMNCCCRNIANCEEVVNLNLTKVLVEIIVHASAKGENYLRVNATQLLSSLMRHSRSMCNDIYVSGAIDTFVNDLRAKNNKCKELAVRALMKCAEASVPKVLKNKSSVSNVMTLSHPPVEQTRGIRSRLLSEDSLIEIVSLADHKKRSIYRCAQKCIYYLLQGSDASQALLPLIEQGIVPMLHKLSASGINQTKVFSADILAWMKSEIKESTLQIFLRTLIIQGNERLRGHVAVALVHLSFGRSEVCSQFVSTGALRATLGMLRHSSSQVPAFDFLRAIRKHFSFDFKVNLTHENNFVPPHCNELIFNDPKGSDVTLKVTKDVQNSTCASLQNDQRQTLWICYAHKMVLSQHSATFRDIFRSGGENSSEFDVKVNDFDAFRVLLKYFYNCNPDVLWGGHSGSSGTSSMIKNDDATAHLLCNVIILLERYQIIPSVTFAAVQKAISLINPTTLLSLFSAAVSVCNLELGMSCYSYTVENFTTLLLAFDKLQLNRLIETTESFLAYFLMKQDNLQRLQFHEPD